MSCVDSLSITFLPNDVLNIIVNELIKQPNLFDVLDDLRKRKSMYVDLVCVTLTCKQFGGFLRKDFDKFPLVIGIHAGWKMTMKCVYARENGTLKQEYIALTCFENLPLF